MTQQELINLIWSIANKLRGPYRPPQYRKVMIPLTVLRRLDCVLEPTKEKVLAEYKELKARKLDDKTIEATICRRQMIGSENLSKPMIAAAVAEGKKRQLEAAELSAARVLEELRRVSFFDIGELFDDKDRLKHVRALSVEVRAALSSVKVIQTNLGAGDRKREWLHEVKVLDKIRALELLAKHFGLLVDKVQLVGDEDLLERLAYGRQLLQPKPGTKKDESTSQTR